MTSASRSFRQAEFHVSRTIAVAMLAAACSLAVPGFPLVAGTLGAEAQLQPPESPPQPFPAPERFPFPKRTERQRDAILKSDFAQMKKHAAQLAKLANSLRDEVDKSNDDVLSFEIVKKAEQIEKLAKKVKNEAIGY